MSRVGNKPIEIPDSVEVNIDGKTVTVNGPKGELSKRLRPEVSVREEGGMLIVEPYKRDARTRAFWGLSRQLLANMIEGVSNGFQRTLDISGVGYRAEMQGDTLVLHVGYSHPIEVQPPEGVTFTVEQQSVTVSGIDKEIVGNTAARIRKVRPVEPYKGKGIKYAGEQVRRKAGKKAVSAE